MADIGINYDAKVQPSPVRVQLGLSFDNTTLKAKVAGIDPFVIVLKPTGNVAEVIMSGIVYPLAQTLGVTLPPLARSLFDGYSLDVLTIDPSTQTIMGEQITVSPSKMSISNHNGMLMVQSAVDIK